MTKLANKSSLERRLLLMTGHMGSGKDTVGPLALQCLAPHTVIIKVSFATPLRREVNSIITDIRSNANDSDKAVEQVAKHQSVSLDEAKQIVDILAPVVISDSQLSAADHTDEMRHALQYWGTDVRRAHNPDYWIKQTRAEIEHLLKNPHSSVLITDGRFPNEADAINKLHGITVRLNISPEVQLERLAKRDGEHPDQTKLNHRSETALDDYHDFTTIVDVDNLSVEQVVNNILASIDIYCA